jgi:hypothetical protein
VATEVVDWPEKRVMGSTELSFQAANKSQLAKAKPRLMIALHSPNALLQTGLRMCLLEKSQDSTAFDTEQCVLCGPVCLGIIAEYGHFFAYFTAKGLDFLCSRDCVAERKGFEP